ncbi:hypothetical protein CRUP_016406, partial [Coryphaenoides rupestris]
GWRHAIIKLVEVFKTYAGRDKFLGKKEFRKLNTQSDTSVDELRDKYKNKDGKVTFEEYFNLVTDLATARHTKA